MLLLSFHSKNIVTIALISVFLFTLHYLDMSSFLHVCIKHALSNQIHHQLFCMDFQITMWPSETKQKQPNEPKVYCYSIKKCLLIYQQSNSIHTVPGTPSTHVIPNCIQGKFSNTYLTKIKSLCIFLMKYT